MRPKFFIALMKLPGRVIDGDVPGLQPDLWNGRHDVGFLN
jgi:hypothetical protein